MLLVELVMQGVRGIRELARIRFKGGFNIVTAGNESGKTSSADAMVRLLFPNDQPGLTDSLISKYAPDASRAAIVAYSDDGAYYRVIEDFSRRAVNLSRYNASTKDFTLLCKDWISTSEFMAELTGGMTEEEYKNLFILRRDHYAARRLQDAPVAGPGSVINATSREDKTGPLEARLAELRDTLRKAEEAADAEYRVQAAAIKLEEVKKKLDSLEGLYARKEALEAEIAPLKGCESLPENLNYLIKEHEQRQGQKMTESDRLNQEVEGLTQQLEDVPASLLWKDKFFLAGVVAGGASLAAGLFLPQLIPADYFPIGILVGFFLIAVAWYNGSRKNAQRGLIMKEIKTLEADVAEVESRFEEGGAAILEYMRATDSETTAELEDKAGNYRHFRSLLDDIAQEMLRIVGDAGPEGRHEEYKRLEQEVSELQKAAAKTGRHTSDTYAIRQEIDRVENELSSNASPCFGGVCGELGEPLLAAAPAAPPRGFLAEAGLAARVGGLEMETLIPAAEAAAQRHLWAITGGKYVRIEAGYAGDPVLHAKDDSQVNFSDLSHGTKDLVYFCLRIGLIEAIAGKRRLPFILDDALAGFDPARQQAACQALRTLGAKAQVILYTSNPSLKAAGDAGGELK